MVHTLPPKRSKTFEDYAALDVLPSRHAYAMKYRRTHIVFDVYNPSSLKMEARFKRGQGGRRKLTNKNKVPSNWHNFLRHNDYKTDLFHFLADKIAQMTVPNIVVVTKGPGVLSTSETCLDRLDKCFHEEANKRQ